MPPIEPAPSSTASASSPAATAITPGVSVAPIDRDSLAAVLKPAMQAGWDIAPTTARITADGATAQYIIGPAAKLAKPASGSAPAAALDNYYLITISVGSSAMALMSGHVASFEGPAPVAVAGLAKPLGDKAQRTPYSVFWVRGDSVFVDIVHCVEKASGAPPTADALLPLATALDAHFAVNWAADTTKVRPKATLATPMPVKVAAGSVFTVQLALADAGAAHPLKTADDVGARVAGSPVAIQTENGSADGRFSFLAARKGSSRVRMRVADLKTLAVTEVEAAVDVA